jgi:hypothetical protein
LFAFVVLNSLSVLQAGLDGGLFVVLDYCIARTTVPHAQHGAYSGIELRAGAAAAASGGGGGGGAGGVVAVVGAGGALSDPFCSGQLSSCIQRIVQCIYLLCSTDTARAPDLRAMHWLLLCRCIALNSRSVRDSSGADEGGGSGGGAGNEQGASAAGGGGGWCFISLFLFVIFVT